ncbi:polysaccharide pyruvyl transferase family protein [Lactonifactor sp. BIOML-A3]|uniref:polysaccharide pyruvyl transferase family protein n=1 Tax=unclassified Lactonifactor TaxID=2636670 RepID=UPI0012B13825|nr:MULTISPECIES: polysaccharide pyruvyl transferase family protein [unclassified Lactonifactor]MSA01741.1 polysaccharide pyruvyl transferase family protein [Lactonifactor sp. BIOML-A5]MSA08739.1 polysaccharide pyruvyl transferase family protein [Lactonifactor sp. BIOML-A4]MSA13865.1 polysaccharide pyruvyl transferase family protein [Lactonifactor sp. BIOML-A3]MSA17106.1 polysaccharide pyruvyl transferase family protein [Lactonifactor sp. BIOML-A2]MSA37785.1 polysaccharide pyruvyl transferase f
MKIGLCLAHKGVNYGMLLQAYATQKKIESLGYETEIIDYNRIGYKHIRFTPWLPVYFFVEIMKKYRNKKTKITLDKLHKQNVDARKKVSNEFISENLLHRVKCNGIEQLEKYARENFDGVLIGSDQVWPPDSAFGNFTTLRFAPDSMNKIAYAPSLGVSEYPIYCRSSAAQFWKRINHLSVREEQGKEIIQSVCDIPVEVVVDPTYLFTKDEWEQLIPVNNIVNDKYILCYFLGNTREHKELARAFADKTGIKIVSILSTESVSDIDVSYADEIVTGRGPKDFINLIRGAEYVLTDSFHGLAFSVINNKNFFIFYRTKVGSKNSRNSRIDNILKSWELENRLVLNDAKVEDFDMSPIDYDKVNELVRKKRDKSLSFLKNALEDCKQ